jgi:hypothetical protein
VDPKVRLREVELKSPSSRTEREKGRAPAFVRRESMGQPPAHVHDNKLHFVSDRMAYRINW